MFCHRRRRATQHAAAIPLRPSGYERCGAICGVAAPLRWGHIAFVAAPCIRPRGAHNAAHPITRTGS
jgi:hypothetical protein